MSNNALFGAGPALPPAYPERAAWGTAPKLRQWQEEALAKYFANSPQDFLAVATPGAGKTTFALRVATELVERRIVNRIVVVAPTDHLKRQWSDAAAKVGLSIDPNFRNADGRHGEGFIGVAVTYAQVASKPMLHRAKTEAAKTLVCHGVTVSARHLSRQRVGSPSREPRSVQTQRPSRLLSTPKTPTASAVRGRTTRMGTVTRCGTT